jgi:hypothetical protein
VSTAIIIVFIIAGVIIAAVLAIGTMAVMRRRGLQHRFGPEYDRVVGESDSKLQADAELKGRERRVRDLDIRPLTNSARGTYADRWAGIQEQFVDAPGDAVAASQLLVVTVMSERGYPTEHPDQVLADLSVEHASTLDRFRSAEKISESAASGTASTEDLRLAMIDYRALFNDLLGEADPMPGSADADNSIADADNSIADADNPIADADNPIADADNPIADEAGYTTTDRKIRELAK